jgi:type IV conjugative transfer system lipoprotein TraV
MVKTGQLSNNQSNSTPGTSSPANSTATGDFGNFSTPFPDSVITPGAPLRIQEQVMPVWFAPYQDKQGNYHDAATMYTIVHPGTWAGSPVPEVDDEGSGS